MQTLQIQHKTLTINIYNNLQRNYFIKGTNLKKLAKTLCEIFSSFLESKSSKQTPKMKLWKAKTIYFDLTLCGDSKMKSTNLKFRGKNKTTDVLSFPTYATLRKRPPKGEILFSELFLGDIMISLPQCLRQSKEDNISFEDEFIDLMAHGFLHLLGYDHEKSKSEAKIMFGHQRLLCQRALSLK